MPPSRLLHIFPTFEVGGAQRRTTTLMAALGDRYRHQVVALNGDTSARRLLPPDFPLAAVDRPAAAHFVSNVLGFRHLVRRQRPDLVLTYNWGSIEAVAGARLARVCPLIHTEDGFGPDEAARLKTRRVAMRRLLLPHVDAMVVPSQTLFSIATERYGLEPGQVVLIVNGVDVDRFAQRTPDPRLRASFDIAPDAFVVGAVGRLSAEKNLSLLIERFAHASIREAILLLVGNGPEHAMLEAVAERFGVRGSVRFAGEQSDPVPFYSMMDLFAMSSVTEQMPLGLLEAMASGLPAVCTDVGDSRFILGKTAAEQCFPLPNAAPYIEALRRFGASSELRRRIGSINQTRARQEYSLQTMIQRWDGLYSDVIARWRAGHSSRRQSSE